MLFRYQKRNNYKETKATSEDFLKQCSKVIYCWTAILILMIAVLILIFQKAEQTEVKLGCSIAFSAICLIDMIVALKAIPISFKLLRDETYRDAYVKSSIWKLRLLILTNLLFSLGFICWIWATYKGGTTTADQILKWFFIAILTIGILSIKGIFIKIYLSFKRHIHALFAGFTMIKQQPEEPEIYSIEKVETIEPMKQLESSDPIDELD
ncbi:hypothetical protein [Candidatus Mycoplasma haematohominis]|uniref:hypothetical protein n=1 Tax=Candidatus Mycoplasma haematohominis TaxID=1494318 RepID=UPI001C0A6E15|nr:hypothetical protein [Candidatus Mycoplasma haemohominis]